MKTILYTCTLILTISVTCSFISLNESKHVINTNSMSFQVDTTYLDNDLSDQFLQSITTDSTITLMGSYGDAAMLTLNLSSFITPGIYQLDSMQYFPSINFFDSPVDYLGKSVNGYIIIVDHDTINNHITGLFSGEIKFNSSKTRNISNGDFDFHY